MKAEAKASEAERRAEESLGPRGFRVPGMCGFRDFSGFRVWGFRAFGSGYVGLGALGFVGSRVWGLRFRDLGF